MLLPEMPPHIEFRYRLNVRYDSWINAMFCNGVRRFAADPSRYLVPRYVFKNGGAVEDEECVIVTKMASGNEVNIFFWDEQEGQCHDLHVPTSWLPILEEDDCALDLFLTCTSSPPLPAYASYRYEVAIEKYGLSEIIF